MNIRLTYYDWMVVRELIKKDKIHLGDSPENDLLLDLWTGLSTPYENSLLHNKMHSEGLIELIDEFISREQFQLRSLLQRAGSAHY